MKTKFLLLAAMAWLHLARAGGLLWPTNQLLPSFSPPAPVLDCIDVSSATGPEQDLFASLEGIVNRAQPQILCVSSGSGEGEFTWLNLHNQAYVLTNGFNVLLQFRTNVTGLVVTDPSLPDTLNLATTMAGVNNELICDPSLLATLTNAPYNLPVVDDLRGRFANKYAAYGWLYTNYWPLCTHRLMAGLETNLDGNLRDYLVAAKVATVWLDPVTPNEDATLLGRFVASMTPANGVYIGWWPSEGDGLTWIANYGIPVLASDYFCNGSYFSAGSRTLNVPPIPPPPPLQNKVYVAFILSDGDNVQYMQHVMKMDWDGGGRGSLPLSWTASSLAADLDPVMLNYYWSTATSNDCLISGPSGAGYTHAELWSGANLSAMAAKAGGYLQRSGLRIITVWDKVTSGIAKAFATNCPVLLGLTDENGTYNAVDLGLRTIALNPGYASTTNQLFTAITNAALGWNGTAPLFIPAQADVWDIGPTALASVASMLNSLNPNEYQFVRADHLFMLCNRVYGPPTAVTQPATAITPGGATLRGMVSAQGTNTSAWLEWGANGNYGSLTAVTNPANAGTLAGLVTARITGLAPHQTYHYQVVASNLFGMAPGGDRQFTTGGSVVAWGGGSLGETNVPAGLTNVVGVSCGAYHALVVKNDGTVTAWGDNNDNQTNVPAGLTNVVAVAGGFQHSLALLANGTVVAWGDNTFGQTNVPAGLTNVTAIAAGGYHSLALNANQTVTAWGYNAFGQTNVPAGLTNVVGVAAGLYHNVVLKADGTVTAWGYGAYGQTNVPGGLGHVLAVAAGQYHSVALKAAGAFPAGLIPANRWVADSLTNASGSPVSNWTDVIAGASAAQPLAGNRPVLSTNVINGHQTVRFAGGSGSGQYLTVAAASSPIASAGSFTLVVVFRTTTAGNASASFFDNTGLLGAEQPGVTIDWGFCLNGSELGAGLGAGANGCGADFSLYGGDVTDGNPHAAMYVRAGDTISLYVDGARVAMQDSLCTEARGNFPFQIGAMTTTSYFFTGDIAEIQLYNRALSPLEIISANEVLAATYGLTGAAGSVAVWGYNTSGQANAPDNLTNLWTVASGSASAFNLALTAGGTVQGWGSNSQGQTNVPPALTNVTALAAGAVFGLAIGSEPPVAAGTNVSGYVNHDLVLTLPAFSPDGSPLTCSLLTLPAAGTLCQYAAGVPGPAVTATNTPVSDPGGRIIFAPAPGQTGTPYAAFDYVGSDGLYNSSPARVTVNILLPAAPQFSDAVWNPGAAGAGNISLNFSGSSNATYSVWAATNLLDWVDLGTAVEAPPGLYQFMDATITNWPQRFYRLSAP